MTQHAPPSIDVARHAAIANIYQQISEMQFTCADDALDAANAMLRLSEATMDDIPPAYYEPVEPPTQADRGQ